MVQQKYESNPKYRICFIGKSVYQFQTTNPSINQRLKGNKINDNTMFKAWEYNFQGASKLLAGRLLEIVVHFFDENKNKLKAACYGFDSNDFPRYDDIPFVRRAFCHTSGENVVF